MTKIKIDIESDKDIVQANLSIKYSEGNTIIKEVINSEVANSDSVSSFKKDTKKSSSVKKGIDSSFTQTY